MSGEDNDALTPSVRVHTDEDTFKPVTRDDVSDLGLLPRRFDLFVAETRQALEMLGDKLLAPLLEIKDAVADLRLRATHTEERLCATERVQVEHERRIAALEAVHAQPPKPRKARRKTTTRKKARR